LRRGRCPDLKKFLASARAPCATSSKAGDAFRFEVVAFGLPPLPAEVVGKGPKGVRVRIYGLNGLLPFGRISGIKHTTPPNVVETKVQRLLGEQFEVDVLPFDADRRTVIVSEHMS
jgi:hypothetical protein